MAIYSSGFTSVVLTKEGAARANELNNQGLQLKVTHFRVYRTSTLVQNLPYEVTGLETKSTLNSWTALPNNDSSFEIIENFPDPPMRGYLTLIGVLGAEIGTFSYDAVGLFLEDDTLYGIAVTTHLLTKRKASAGTMSNIQEFSFNIGHTTVKEVAEFSVNDIIIDYTKIDEVEYPHLLPKGYDESNRVYRVTSNNMLTYKNNRGFVTTLASQAPMKLVGSNLTAPVWVFSDYTRLFDSIFPTFKLTTANKVKVDIPSSTAYPIELISSSRSYVLSLADPNKKIPYSVLRLTLESRTSDSTGFHFVFAVSDVTLGLTEDITLQGILATRADDGLYQDSILTALRRMADIQYAKGRRYKADSTTHPSTVLKPFFGQDTVWTKYDNRLEVSTSDYEKRLVAPSILQPIIHKTGTTDHMTLRASNIWLRDSGDELYPELELDKYIVSFGSDLTALITATGYPNGAMIAYYIKPSRNQLLTTPTKVYGYATVTNGRASILIKPNWTIAKNSDSVTVGLVGYPEQDTLAVLEMLEVETFFSSDSAGNSRITTANEGTTVYFHVQSIRPIERPATVYTKITGSTTTEGQDFTGTIPKFMELIEGKYVLPIRLTEDQLTEGDERLEIAVSNTSDLGLIIGSSVLLVKDTSTTPNPVYRIYFARDAAGNNEITNTVDLGSKVFLIVKATGVPASKAIRINLSGTFSLANDASPALTTPLNLTLVNGFVSYPINSKLPTPVAPPPPSGPTERVLRITANVTTGYNLYSNYVSTFGTPTSKDMVRLIVETGIYVVGETTAKPALDCTGNWPAGMSIVIENKGIISGRGGDGCNWDRGEPIAGGNGGTGILAQSANPVSVQNSGTVAGGGGGSGSAWGTVILWNSTPYPTVLGYSGHGGRPLGGAGKSGTGPSKWHWGMGAGNAATLQAPGSRGKYSVTGYVIDPMSGGDLGAAGTNGSGGGTNKQARGGAGGKPYQGPVTITNLSGGSVKGSV